MPSADLKSRVANIIGRTDKPSVLELVVHALACEWRKAERKVYRVEHARSEADIIRCAKILEEFTRLATRTYEGKPVTTGIVILERWVSDDLLSYYWHKWLTRWPRHSLPSVEKRGDLIAAAALADGKRSLVVTDTSGQIRGIINLGRSQIGEVIIHLGGYVVVTNWHREVFLLSGFPSIAPVCYHDGFAWREGAHVDVDSLGWVRNWASYARKEQFKLEKRAVTDFDLEEWDREFIRWFAFGEIIEAMSGRRLSGIFVVCDADTLRSSQIVTLLSSLRPELDNMNWGHIDDNTPVWTNLFRLDGAHFVSKQIEILAICQQISVPGSRDGSRGTGRAAARFLSEKLGGSGVVIKVSADGPVSIFYRGQIIKGWIED